VTEIVSTSDPIFRSKRIFAVFYFRVSVLFLRILSKILRSISFLIFQ
jgi:hypothetical protein